MMRSCSRLGFGIAIVLAGFQTAFSAGEETIKLKASIEQWMEVMQDLQAEEERWGRERQVLQDSAEGLESELIQLEEDIKAVQERLDNADQSSQDKLAEKRKFDAARELLAGELDSLEVTVAEVLPLVPDFFMDPDRGGSAQLKKAMEQLKKHRGTEDKKKLGLNARLSPLVQVLKEVERFNKKIWPVTQSLEVEGTPKQMRVAYFGLGVAYAVDGEATVAMLGYPTAAGWEFSKLGDKEVAVQVKTLIGAADNSGKSQMVTLPLKFAN